MGSRHRLQFLLLPVWLAAAAPAQDPVQIAVVGASVSGGFEDGPVFGAEAEGDSLALHLMLRSAWREDELRVSSALPILMLSMFQDPEGNGRRQLESILRREPDLVLAIDFPFWFGYVFRHGKDRDSRLRLQEKCFELLEDVQRPLVVGDYPDMTGAAKRMLSPSQIPDAGTLAELNARLRQWAVERGNTWVFPLSKLVATFRTDGFELPVEGGTVKLRPADLMQPDKLHPNRLGMAVLGYELQRFLRDALPEAGALRPPDLPASAWVAAARASAELETVAERSGK